MFVIRNWQFGKVREHLRTLDEHTKEADLPQDLDEKHQDQEVKKMIKGFTEIGFNVTLVNMSEATCTNPFEIIEKVLLDIRSMCT